MNWGTFIASLLWCRYKYRKHIFSTYTQIAYDLNNDGGSLSEDHPAVTASFDFKYERLQAIFGPKISSHLSNLFYTLNSLLENPLYGSIYSDMLRYPDYVLKEGEAIQKAKDLGGNDSSIESFAIASGYVIGRGAELRSYGTYDTIEEVTGRFSEVKGGCHLAIFAMEVFPKTIIKDWQGFITIGGEPKFSHINQVINVTTDSLWDPQCWWAIYHEIAHVLIDKYGNLLDYINDPIIDNYLYARDDKTTYEELIEITAEIIGFEIGFFQDFNLFFNFLWTYLQNIVPYYNVPLEHYAIRSFVLELFESHFRNNQQLTKITKKDWENADYLFELFIKHMQRIEKHNDQLIFNDKSFIAANHVKKIRDLYPVCKKLAGDITSLKIVPSKKHISSKNTTQVIKNILAGKVWWDDITSPQAVLYRILNTKNLKFNAEIAMTISFWNKKNILERKIEYRK